MTNRELVEKATIAADQLAAAGKLNPMQSDKFIDFVIDVTKLRNVVRVVKFRNEEANIDKIGVGKRVAVPKAEATDPGVRRGVSTSKVTLKPVEIMVPFEISDTFGEINIEGEDVKEHIVKMMATQLANDIEDLYINGNLLGPAAFEDDIFIGGSSTQVVKDSYLGLTDGWWKLAQGATVVDAEGDDISSQLFSDMLNAMPEKFKRDRSQLRFLSATDIEQNFRNKVSTRATAGGDAALSTTQNLTPFGVELVPVPLLGRTPKIVEHVTLTGTTPVALTFKPIVDGSEIVTLDTLGSTPVTPYIEGTDYNMDYPNGTIARDAGGALPTPVDVKVTYNAYPQVLLTHFNNLIVAIGRDIRIEKDRDIFKGVDQYAITTKVSVNIEELEAVVKMTNIGLE
jgi:hypothetical protein